MDEKGEFEQRPEVKPASSVPLPKEKASPALKILCVLFVLISLGLGGFIIYDKVMNDEGSAPQCAEVADDSEEAGNDDGGEAEAEGDITGFWKHTDAGVFFVTKKGDVYYEPAESPIYFLGSHSFSLKFDNSYLPGIAGTYTVSDKDIDGLEVGTPTESIRTRTFSGYKIDVEDIIAINEVGYGQQQVAFEFVLISKSGEASWLTIKPGYGSNVAKAKLTKKLGGYENVVNAIVTSANDYTTTILILSDGSQVTLSHAVLETTSVD